MKKALQAGLVPGFIAGAADVYYLRLTNSAGWDPLDLLSDGLMVCAAVLTLAFYMEFISPKTLTPRRWASRAAGALLLLAFPMTLRLAWSSAGIVSHWLVWWSKPLIALSLSYLIVGVAQLIRRGAYLFRSIVSVFFAIATAVTLVPALRMDYQVAAFACFVGTVALLFNASIFGYVAFKETHDVRRTRA